MDELFGAVEDHAKSIDDVRASPEQAPVEVKEHFGKNAGDV